MPDFATHDEIVEHSRRVGHPAGAWPADVRDAAAAHGIQLPPVINLQLGVVTPPGPGFCHVCGEPVPEGQAESAHAVAGFEQAQHPATAAPLRMLVNHCDAHLDSDACDPATPGGFCEAVEGADADRR